MVAPKDNRLACSECHDRDGRLAELAGFYMPGRDNHAGLDLVGWLAVVAALLGVTAHGLFRWHTKRRRKEE